MIKQHFLVSQREEDYMNVLFCKSYDILNAIYSSLPDHVLLHGKRVAKIAKMLGGYISDKMLPTGLNNESYCAALYAAGLYHEIGIYLVRNNIENRPAAAVKILEQYWTIDIVPGFSETVLETVYNWNERYDGKGYPNALTSKNIPLHANLCLIADAIDMIVHSNNKFKIKNIQKAKDYIHNNMGTIFSKDAVQCFLNAQDEIFEYYENSHKTVFQQQDICLWRYYNITA